MSEEYKRVFVLGNGFDLAHYLPTQYIHFMEAMAVVENWDSKSNIKFDNLFDKRINKNDPFFKHTCELYETERLFVCDDDVSFLRENLKKNFWYHHFTNHLNSVITWIDFETEIESVLLNMEELLSSNFDLDTIISRSDSKGGSSLHTDTSKIRIKSLLYSNVKNINSSFWEKFGAKGAMYRKMFRNLYVTSENKKRTGWHDNINENDSIYIKYLKVHSDICISFNGDEIFKELSNSLDDFKIIFQKYISLIINKLEPKVPFHPFGDLSKEIKAVFTFNYSNSFERFYPGSLPTDLDIQYIHGSAEAENIVLGISDLSDELKKYKIFNFIKSYQAIIQRTDYKEIMKISEYLKYRAREKTELLIWGHSIDISDKKYILDMLDSSSGLNWESHIWYFERPHTSLANLMSILGEESVLKKINNRNIRLDTEAPNIIDLNKKKAK